MNKKAELIKGLLLPIPHLTTPKAVKILAAKLNDFTVNEEDHTVHFTGMIEDWKDGKPSENFISIIKLILKECNSDSNYKETIGDNYIDIHEMLKKSPFLDHALSSIVLSHLGLICHLSDAELMSGSKILSILQVIDSRITLIRWQDINNILNKLSLKSQLKKTEVEKQYSQDLINSTELFGDATLEDCGALINQLAVSLKFPANIFQLFSDLIDDEKIHLPYLQILHYQCSIIDYFDHRLASAYEFAPRGVVANFVFDKWSKVVNTGNPILNNMKAVDEVNDSWANSKKDKEYESAKNLVRLFGAMDSMGFSATRELSQWIRAFLLRYIDQKSIEISPVEINTKEDIHKISEKIIDSPTETFGVLEQRFVDYVSLTKYEATNYRVRGNGDSVNSNNWSKKKLGDIDFQDSEKFKILAFEPHGGNLTEVYLQDHIRSLKRTILRRKEELELIADIDRWEIEITFIAYSFSTEVERTERLEGVDIKLIGITFKDFYATIKENNIEIFKSSFLGSINSKRTPEKVREKVREFSK